jgi:hypothetical protein
VNSDEKVGDDRILLTKEKPSSSIIQWAFGEGIEGVFTQPTTKSHQALIVGRGIPWWGMVITRLDLRIHSILLSDFQFFSLIGAYFGSDIPVGRVSDLSRSDILMTRNVLKVCSVVAMEVLPKLRDTLSEMWKMSKIKLILVAHGWLIPPPPGWRLSRRRVPHAAVGGVTDVVGHIGIYFRSDHVDVTAALGSITAPPRPRRDLHSILMMAVVGNRCGTPNGPKHSTITIGDSVIFSRPGVVLSNELLGVKTNGGLLRLPRVKTVFGGNMWVVRQLTPAEVLSCWDVPEKLGQLMTTLVGKGTL